MDAINALHEKLKEVECNLEEVQKQLAETESQV